MNELALRCLPRNLLLKFLLRSEFKDPVREEGRLARELGAGAIGKGKGIEAGVKVVGTVEMIELVKILEVPASTATDAAVVAAAVSAADDEPSGSGGNVLECSSEFSREPEKDPVKRSSFDAAAVKAGGSSVCRFIP